MTCHFSQICNRVMALDSSYIVVTTNVYNFSNFFFVFALILTRSGLGLLPVIFSQIYNRVLALYWCQNFVSAQYL